MLFVDPSVSEQHLCNLYKVKNNKRGGKNPNPPSSAAVLLLPQNNHDYLVDYSATTRVLHCREGGGWGEADVIRQQECRPLLPLVAAHCIPLWFLGGINKS